jgi:uncharacterized membrane protein YkoI
VKKRTIAGLVTTAALAVGVIGTTAYAETPPPSASPSAPPTAPATPASGTPSTSPETEKQEPSYTGSVQAPKGTGTEDEAAETAALAALAKLSEADAKNAALAKFPGATVTKASLGDENGSVVWEIQLTDSSNVAQEVKIDAGNGAILATEAGGADSEKSGGHD